MTFEHYIHTGTKRLRCGYTTGSCAALAAKAAATMLLGGKTVDEECIQTPAGLSVKAEIHDARMFAGGASCAVAKDGGDDMDATDGILIYAEVRQQENQEVHIEGGVGVGRVTKPGLEQPVGSAAINRVPREMIAEAVRDVASRFGYEGGFKVTIEVPRGEELAQKTFNQHLGVLGGISILGTTGIVEPRSIAALKDSIEIEIRQHAALGNRSLIITPGNYGKDYVNEQLSFLKTPMVSCSNFIGDALDFAARYKFERVLLVGHIGKMVKLAGGIMDTHSRMADCRTELFCAHAAWAGATQQLAQDLMECATADACVALLKEACILEAVLESLAHKTEAHLERRLAGACQGGFLVFSNQYGELYRAKNTTALIESMKGAQ